MPQPELRRSGVSDRPSPRTKQDVDMEILVAASEVETLCAGWLADQRINSDRPTS